MTRGGQEGEKKGRWADKRDELSRHVKLVPLMIGWDVPRQIHGSKSREIMCLCEGNERQKDSSRTGYPSRRRSQ